ncbi:hypothetical protein D3C80_1789760 [compost metagenome]
MCLGAELQNRTTTDRVVNTHQCTYRTIAGRNLLHGQGIGDVVDVSATPFFRDHHSQQTKFAHLLHQVIVDPAGFFHVFGFGRDLTTGKVAGHVANHSLLFSQFEVVHWVSL